MKGTAKYDGDEVYVWFSCDMEKSDYGVPGSPVWFEPQNIKIDEIEILGVGVKAKDLPSDLVNALHALSEEVEFEMEMGE